MSTPCEVQGIYAKIKSRNDIMRNVENDDKTDVRLKWKEDGAAGYKVG